MTGIVAMVAVIIVSCSVPFAFLLRDEWKWRRTLKTYRGMLDEVIKRLEEDLA